MPWVAQCTVNARPVAWRRTQNEAAKVCTAGRMARRSCIASRRARDCAWVDVTRQFCLPRVQTAAKSFQVHALVNQAWRRVDCKSLVAMLEASALRKEAGKAGDVLSYPNMCGWGGMGKPGLVFGFEELSSLNQHRIMLARQIAIKMLNADVCPQKHVQIFAKFCWLLIPKRPDSWQPSQAMQYPIPHPPTNETYQAP
eukprot:scaffold170686_cov23-Tisochrysis_lutea.AAC.2